MIPKKSNTPLARSLAAACIVSIGAPAIQGAVVVESFESGTLNGWNAGTLNGVTTTVNADRASDGTYSAANSFTVPASFSGWTVNTILERDPRSFMDAGATTLTVDVYTDWANPNGWGVYGNTLLLILNNSNGWSTVAPASGSLVNGAFSTLTWDLTPHAAAITDPGLGYSILGIAWHVGTWAGGGDALPNGTQTFGIDSITVTSVPEPSSAIALLSAGLMAFRRRRR
jgi:hypothetical protein